MKRIVIVTAVVVMLLAVFLYMRWSARPVVEVYVAKRGTAISAVYGTVKVVHAMSVKVRARTGGIIHFEDPARKGIGTDVKKGELLATIVNEDLEREIAKAAAELRNAEERKRIGPPSAPQVKTLEATLERMLKLLEQKNVPASEVERVRNDLQHARQEALRQQLDLERNVIVWSEQLSTLQARLERCKLLAPIDGELTVVNVLDGDYVFDNSTPFTVATKQTFLEGQVNEEDVGYVKPKMKAMVKLYSYPHQEFHATVSMILPTPNNERYTVTLDLDNPPDNLLGGMTGEMNIVTGRRENALIIPSRALTSERVWVVDDGVVKPRNVKVGFRNIERAEIVEGLSEGEQVIVADQDLLRPGQRVRAITINK